MFLHQPPAPLSLRPYVPLLGLPFPHCVLGVCVLGQKELGPLTSIAGNAAQSTVKWEGGSLGPGSKRRALEIRNSEHSCSEHKCTSSPSANLTDWTTWDDDLGPMGTMSLLDSYLRTSHHQILGLECGHCCGHSLAPEVPCDIELDTGLLWPSLPIGPAGTDWL